ncbi:MAG: SGNH/GDSL hydrolase family protein [Thermodesulfobacteriota bacterium]
MSVPRRLLRGLARGALVVASIWIAGEVAARSLNLVDRLNGFPRRLFVASDQPDLGYELRPGVDTIARGVHVTINERGMRGPSLPAERAAGTRRILVLGDSVAFGFRLEYDDTFGVRLERELEERTRAPHEVLNAGVEGYNTQNQLAWLRKRLPELEPDVVVLVFNLNDYDYGPVMGPLGILTLDQTQRVRRFSLANVSEFYLLLRWLVATQGRVWVGDAVGPTPQPGGAAADRFDPFDRYVSALRKQYYRAPSDRRWQVMVDSLRALHELTSARGIRLVLAIVPDGDQIGVAQPDLTPQSRLRELCAEIGLECVDLQPAFATSGGELFMDIMHPNAEGHRLMAREVARHLLGEPVTAAARAP